LTYRQSETSFVIHGYISLSGLISFLIVQSFQNSAHPTLQPTAIWGSERGVDLMDHVKSRGFGFLLLRSSRKFWGFQTGCRPDESCKVSRVLVSSTPLLTEVWGFRTRCGPDGSFKVSRILVSSIPLLTLSCFGSYANIGISA
jgi:hypothetical protein